MTKSDEKLRECPFCGAIAAYDPDEGEWISCANMECGMYETSVSLDTWNTRPDVNKELVEALEGLTQDLLNRAEWDCGECKLVCCDNGVFSRAMDALKKAGVLRLKANL